MSLYALADHMASKGRNGDTMLVHMAPSEVAGLHALALSHGEKVTINPETGLPEMFSLKKLLKAVLPTIAGFALGPAGFGIFSTALGAGAAVGGATALATGSLSKGLMAGLGAYGGSTLGSALSNAGAAKNLAGAYVPTAEALNPSNFAPMSAMDKLGAGIKGLTTEAGRTAFMQNIGGGAKALQAAYMASAPALLGAASEPAKGGMPTSVGSPAYYRPYEFDPETKGLRFLGAVDAAKANAPAPVAAPAPVQELTTKTEMPEMQRLNEPMYAGGGAVAFADGGTAPQTQPTAGLPALTYRPLSEVNQRAAQQGIGNDPLNDRIQGLEAALASRGLTDEFNQYFVNTGGFGGAYKEMPTTTPVRTDNALQNAYYNAIRTDLSEAERQKSAGDLGNILKQYEDRVRNFEDQTRTSTTPPQITSTEAVRPTTTISPGSVTLQPAAPVPLTSTKPPDISITQAPVMPSIPVGGSGDAGAATTRPFDWQGASIDRMPVVQQKRPEEAMNDASLDAYLRLMGMGTRASTPVTTTTAPSSTGAGTAGVGNAFTTAYQRADTTTSTPTTFRNFTDKVAEQHGLPKTAVSKSDGTQLVLTTDPFSSDEYGQPLQYYAPASSVKTSGTTTSTPTPTPATTTTTTPQVYNNIRQMPPVDAGPGMEWYWDGTKWAKMASFIGASGDTAANGGLMSGYAAGGFALGGLGTLGGYSDGGRLLRGPGDGVSDSIPATIADRRPARLADGEFVVPARIVSELGNGSTEAGARKLYAMMDRVQRARGKTTGKGRVAVNSRSEKYLPA